MAQKETHVFTAQTYSTQECEELDALSRLNDWEAEYRQLGAGRFQADFDLYASPELRITQQYCNQEMVAFGCPPRAM